MKELTPTEWEEEIMAGIEFRQTYAREREWSMLEQCYYNEPGTEVDVGENLIFEQGDALQAGVSSTYPEIIVEAEHPASLETAPAVEGLDNWFVRKLKLREKVEAAVLNGYLYGKLILKVGYDSLYGYDPYYDMGSRTDPAGMTFTQFDKQGKLIEFSGATPGMPWVEVVLPHDFVVPWGTKTLDDAEWCAVRFVRLNRDLKTDPKYSNTQRLEPEMSMQSFTESYIETQVRRDRLAHARRFAYSSSRNALYNELWEIHDKRHKKVYVISFNHSKFLRKTNNALQIGGQLPFVADSFISHSRSFWSTPLAYYLMQHQREMYDISVQTAKQRKVNNLKFLVNENALSEEEEERVLSNENALFVKVTGGMDVNKVVKAFPQINNFDLRAESNYIRRNARSVAGFSRNQMGEFDDSSRRTATETLKVEAGSQKRESRRSNVVENMYIGAIKKINGIIFKVWKRPRSVKVSPAQWKQMTGMQLKGDYYYDAHLAQKQPMNSTQRRMNALGLFSQLAQIPGANLQALWDFVIRSADDPSFQTFFDFGGGGGGQLQLPQGASVAGGVGSAGGDV